MPILIPLPEDFAVRRADLNLGLRSALLHYQELAVPGIGGAWCTRHFSWAVAGIALAAEPDCAGIRPATIANAIEAMANKAEWTQTPQDERTQLSVLGKRAFAREPEEWRFDQLKTRTSYVFATYRQSVTRALSAETGLGFTLEPGRFNAMQLSPAGGELVDAFLDSQEQRGMGKGVPNLRIILLKWIDGEFYPKNYLAELQTRLGYRHATKAEKEIVRNRLVSLVPAGGTSTAHDPERRLRLTKCIEKLAPGDTWDDVPALQEELRINGGTRHANEIDTALKFDELRNAAVNLLARLAVMTEQAGSKLNISDAVRDEKVKSLYVTLKTKAQGYLDRGEITGLHSAAETFARWCLGEIEHTIDFVVRRDNRILQAANGGIWRGPVFRADFTGIQGADTDERDKPSAGRPRRIFQYINLWTSCNG